MTEIPDVTSPREITALFQRYGLHPRRHLGQNFLIDGNIVKKIIAAAGIKAGDAVVEVGPGAGALTLALARPGIDLLVLEIDRGLVGLLKDLLRPWPEARVVEADALKISWEELACSFASGKPVKLVSNLPYNISGPLMYALLKESFPFSVAVLMFQKEVAERLVAEPGDSDYGSLSVLCRYYTEGKIMFDVSRNVFWPRPKIGSAVLKLKPRERILPADMEPLLWKLVQGVFQQRRKTILNSMARLFLFSRSLLTDLLKEAEIDPAIRPEQLNTEQFAKLTRITYNYRSKLS